MPRGLGDLSTLAGFLSGLRGSRVEVRAPERGEKRRLQELAQRNAELALSSASFVAERSRLARVEALEELREVLNLESLPLRIECFDISNIQGQEIVGSMVVFEDGVARKAHYRKFAIRGQEGQDDFAAMAELVGRRFARLAGDAGAEEFDESFQSHAEPGRDRRRQGPAERRARRDGGLRPSPGRGDRTRQAGRGGVPARPPGPGAFCPTTRRACGCCSVCATRRTGSRVSFHRARRDRSSRASMFDQLDGVGPARRRALLRHFGSAERVLDASAEELEGVPGVPAKTARQIYAQLHRAGGA